MLTVVCQKLDSAGTRARGWADVISRFSLVQTVCARAARRHKAKRQRVERAAAAGDLHIQLRTVNGECIEALGHAHGY